MRVVEHARVEGVADLAFQRAQRALAAHSFGDLLVVVRAALGAAVADLGDRGHVDDITKGDNTYHGAVTVPGFKATKGWDAATGLGTPKAQALIPALAS